MARCRGATRCRQARPSLASAARRAIRSVMRTSLSAVSVPLRASRQPARSADAVRLAFKEAALQEQSGWNAQLERKLAEAEAKAKRPHEPRTLAELQASVRDAAAPCRVVGRGHSERHLASGPGASKYVVGCWRRQQHASPP